jgi:5-methylcytosine-specific restriction endonuclease McrA
MSYGDSDEEKLGEAGEQNSEASISCLAPRHAEVPMADHSLERWRDQKEDPFGNEPYPVPHEGEIRARAEQVLQDNRDALRLFVEQAIWDVLDLPEQRKVLMTLLWHWKDVDPKWVAEASFMPVADVYDVAESQPLMTFPCLRCGAELLVRNRLHRIRLQGALEDYCRDETGDSLSAELLCETCAEQGDDLVEQQRRLDRERYEALIAAYRARPYELRRESREWAVLKRRVHARDGYRCRLCGQADVGLQVHHSTYKNYAQEHLEDLITLCGPCHRRVHDLLLGEPA